MTILAINNFKVKKWLIWNQVSRWRSDSTRWRYRSRFWSSRWQRNELRGQLKSRRIVMQSIGWIKSSNEKISKDKTHKKPKVRMEERVQGVSSHRLFTREVVLQFCLDNQVSMILLHRKLWRRKRKTCSMLNKGERLLYKNQILTLNNRGRSRGVGVLTLLTIVLLVSHLDSVKYHLICRTSRAA